MLRVAGIFGWEFSGILGDNEIVGGMVSFELARRVIEHPVVFRHLHIDAGRNDVPLGRFSGRFRVERRIGVVRTNDNPIEGRAILVVEFPIGDIGRGHRLVAQIRRSLQIARNPAISKLVVPKEDAIAGHIDRTRANPITPTEAQFRQRTFHGLKLLPHLKWCRRLVECRIVIKCFVRIGAAI